MSLEKEFEDQIIGNFVRWCIAFLDDQMDPPNGTKIILKESSDEVIVSPTSSLLESAGKQFCPKIVTRYDRHIDGNNSVTSTNSSDTSLLSSMDPLTIKHFMMLIIEDPDGDYPYLQLDENPPLKYTLFAFAYALIVLISLVGNMFVVWVIISKKRTRSAVNLFIANLAVSDLLMTILNVPFTAAQLLMSNWIFGPFLCDVVPFIKGTSVYVSTLTMTFIAVDRFRAILMPMRRRIDSRVASIISITIIWIAAMIFSSPFLFFNQIVPDPYFKTIHRCRVVYPEPQDLYRKTIGVVTFALQFVIPFTVMVSLYTRIGFKIWSRTTIGATTREQENRQFIAKKRTIIMLLLVALVFAVCWLPLNIYHILTDLGYWDSDFHFLITVHWLAMSSVCYNPFIYFWLNRRFQQILRTGLLRCCGTIKCLPNSSSCTCLGFGCFCQKIPSPKLPVASSPTSESTPRVLPASASGLVDPDDGSVVPPSLNHSQAHHRYSWFRSRNSSILRHWSRRGNDGDDDEEDTGFLNSTCRRNDTVCTQEDVITTPKRHDSIEMREISDKERRKLKSASPSESKNHVVSREKNSTSSAASRNSLSTTTDLNKQDKVSKNMNNDSSSGKSLLRSRNIHLDQKQQQQLQQQEGMSAGCMTRNGKWNNSSKNSLSSSSSAGSGLNHYSSRPICHFKGVRRPVYGKRYPIFRQTCCNHHSHGGKSGSQHDVVLLSL